MLFRTLLVLITVRPTFGYAKAKVAHIFLKLSYELKSVKNQVDSPSRKVRINWSEGYILTQFLLSGEHLLKGLRALHNLVSGIRRALGVLAECGIGPFRSAPNSGVVYGVPWAS